MAAAQDSFRLPRHAVPRRYGLELQPDLEAARFEGQVSIELEVVEPADRLVLNAVDLEIRSAELLGVAGTRAVPEVSFEQPDQLLVLQFAQRLAVGMYQLSMEFAGTLNDQLRGFYRSTFRDAVGTEHVIATTQFEASDARRAFPCWDEPDFKAVFAITLVVDQGLTGLSNGALESTHPRPGGRVEMRFADTMPMSTYLVAFVVGPYEVTEPDLVDGVPVRIAAVPGKLPLTAFAAEVARHSLTFLTDYFGIPYPGGKLDHVAVPDFAAGAMENLGCVTYRESVLLVDPERAAAAEMQRVASVIAHETAHMWFGDLVTMRWWNGTWLNEAFATFMELTTTDRFRPDWQMWTTFGAGKAAAMSTDGLRATRPVEYPVARPEEIEGMFDVLTYQKGGSVLKMLEQYLGREVFRKGISHYLASHAYGNTETADLWDAIETVSGEPVRTIMDTWILQGGYPMVEVSPTDDPCTVMLRQERFLYASPGAGDGGAGAGGDGTAGGGERWAVPVNIRASIEGRVQHERILLQQEQGSCTFSGPVDWVVVNDGAWGFYRVRYAGDLGSRLLAAGPVSVLAPLERLHLVGDTWADVVAGGSELGNWVLIAGAVSSEPDPDVWASIAGALHLLDLAAEEQDRDALQQFARQLARPAWDAVGWDPAPNEDSRASTARGRILAVLAQPGEDPEIIDEARRRFRAHLDSDRGTGAAAGVGSGAASGGESALAPDLVGPVARIVVARGGIDGWSSVFDAYLASDRPQERLRYLYALAETPIEDLRFRTLELMLGPDVRSQDAPFVIAGLLGQRGATAQVWDWIEHHWDRLSAQFPSNLLTRVLEATAAVVDPDLAARVHRFCEQTDLPISAIRLAQIRERMDVNVQVAGRLRGRMVEVLSPAGGSR